MSVAASRLDTYHPLAQTTTSVFTARINFPKCAFNVRTLLQYIITIAHALEIVYARFIPIFLRHK